MKNYFIFAAIVLVGKVYRSIIFTRLTFIIVIDILPISNVSLVID